MIEIGNNLETYLLIGVFVIILIAAIRLWIRISIQSRKKQQEILDSWDNIAEEPELRETDARVISKRCGTEVYGSKSPRCHKEFFITFLTFDGDEVEYPVPENIYLSIEENEVGTLATANGYFYGFCVKEETKET